MEENNLEIKKNLGKMQDKIRELNRQPVFFVGSGISKRYIKSPDWDGLLRAIAEEVNCNYDELKNKIIDYEKIAQELEYFYFSEIIPNYNNGETHKTALRKKIANIFKDCISNFQEDEEIQQFRKTRPTAIITTNYDLLLEKIFGNDYVVHIGQEVLKNNNLNETGDIYKIHGCITIPETIVITKEDYDDFFERSKYLYAKLLTLFWEYPIVFMGYSISDRNIKHILTSMVDVMTEAQVKDLENRVWILDYVEDNKFASTEKKEIELLNGKRLGVICFKLKEYIDFYKEINEITTSQQFGTIKFSISDNVIELLIKPLYQQQDKLKVVTRELLQNALDACKKKRIDAKIKIRLFEKDSQIYLEIKDNGIGMNLQDIKENFLTIGKTNKMDNQEGLVGRYGVGILSIFLIGDYAEVYTKKENSSLLSFQLYIKDDKKQVAWLNEIDEDIKKSCESSFSVIRIRLQKDNINGIKNINEFKKILGLDTYITKPHNSIKVEYMTEMNEVLKLDKPQWFIDLGNDMKLYKSTWQGWDEIREEDKELKSILDQKNIIFYNDMFSKVVYDQTCYKQLRSINIPLVIIDIKNISAVEKEFKTDLSRSQVQISGNMMRVIARGVYKLEVNKVIDIILSVIDDLRKNKIIILELVNQLKNNCALISRNCDMLLKNNKIILSQSCVLKHIEIWGNDEVAYKLAEKFSDPVLCRSSKVQKNLIADKVISNDIICISVDYFDEYIYKASGPHNGLRKDSIICLLHILGFLDVNSDTPYQLVWDYIKKSRERIKEKYSLMAKDGILWFGDSYKINTSDLNIEGKRLMIFKSNYIENYLDKDFTLLLKEALNEKSINEIISFCNE